MKKRIVSLLIMLTMVFGVMPSAYAAASVPEDNTGIPETTQQADTAATAASVRLDAILETGRVSVDGNLSELSWSNWIHASAESTDAPSGSIAAIWNKGHIYIAVISENATNLWLSIGSSALSVNLTKCTVSGISGGTVTKKGNTAEIDLPIKSLSIVLDDYNTTVTFRAGLVNSFASTTFSVESLRISGRVAKQRPMTGFSDGWTTSGNTYSYSCTNDQKVRYSYSLNNKFSTTETEWISQDLCFTDLPVTDGAYLSAYSARGYYYYASRNCGDYSTTNSGDMFFVSVYNSGEGKLKANILCKSATPNAVLDLDVSVGEAFRLVTAWEPDGSLKLFVNGNFVGASNGSCIYRASACGDNVFTCRYSGSGTDEQVNFQVKNVCVSKAAYSSVRGELTATNVLGRADLERVTSDLPMVSTFETTHFEQIPIKWTTTDPSVVEADGTIHRGETEKKCTISLIHKAAALWTKDVTLAPFGVTDVPSPGKYFAAYTDGIIVDGNLRGENWHMSNKLLDADGVLVGEMGAAWNKDVLYLAIRNNTTDIDLKINGKQIQLEQMEKASSGAYTEIAIPMQTIGVTVNQYGLELPVSVSVGEGTFEGTLILFGTEWWGTGNSVEPLPVKPGQVQTVAYNGGQPDGNQGAVEVSNGWHLYNRYSQTGNNPSGVRTYVLFMNDAPYHNFADRTVTTTVEFDFQAISMPVYDHNAIKNTSSIAFACYGVNWTISDARDESDRSNVVSGGIYNAEDGLHLVINGNTFHAYPLNRQVGDLIRITMHWHSDNSLDVYVDGEYLDSIDNLAHYVSGIGNSSFVVNMIRNEEQPQSEKDNMDVYLTNIAFGHAVSDNPLDALTWDTIRGTNTSADAVTADLVLPDKLADEKLGIDYPVTWTSTVPAVTDPKNGKILRPETGAALVTLTATLENGVSKSFRIIVLGKTTDSGNTLVVIGDIDPANGAGEAWNSILFTFDSNNNSVIEDMQKVQTVNVVKLTDLDAYARITRESMTLWISDDNITYTQIEDYKLTQVGNHWYLYDFEATGRYVKVNYTHWKETDADFIAPIDTIIHGYYESVVGSGEGQWRSAAFTYTNTGSKPMQDEQLQISKSTLGITGEDASIRVYLGKELLYHYVDGDSIFVRVKDIAAGQTVRLTVKYGTVGAVDLANKEACFEITYGVRHTSRIRDGARWLLTIPAGTYGEFVVEKEMLIASGSNAFNNGYMLVSYDKGITWSKLGTISQEAINAAAGDGASGGWMFDDETGAIFYETHRYKKFDPAWEISDCVNAVIGSYDMGKTWELIDVIEPDTVDGNTYTYMLSYSDGLKVSSYDGEGPNVDFVFPTGAQYTDTGAFCCRVAYSDDGGRSWKMSPSLLTYGNEKGHEGGLSEGWILENDDGVLVLYSRCQYAQIVNFAKVYSHDFGRTWTAYSTKEEWEANNETEGNKITAVLSSVYTTNTQALMYGYEQNNGIEAPLFLWGGNTTLGGTSYIRTPMSVAVSYDGLETFRNIQNLFAETSLDLYGSNGRSIITNHSVKKVGEDTMVLTFNSQFMVATDFENWFYRTKGAYDAFESGNPFYEGWSPSLGTVENTDKLASAGMQSLHILPKSAIARSIPYLQDGKISLDIYVTEQTDTVLALQPAFGRDPDAYTVAKLTVRDMVLDSGIQMLQLKEGWNRLEIYLALTRAEAWITVNGGEAAAVKLDIAAGDYVCYVSVFNEYHVYLDEFTVVSYLDAEVYTGETQKGAKSAAVKHVENLIEEIGEVTLQDAEAIAAARAAYEALSEEEKAQVENYDDLVAAEEVLKELQEQLLPEPGITLSLNETIDINFKSPEDMDITGLTVKVWLGEEELDASRYSVAEDDGRLRVRYGCNSNKMFEDVTVQFFNADGTAATKARTMSIRTYVETILGMSSNKNLRALVIQLLDYGALAQYYKNNDLDNLANSVITPALRAEVEGYSWPESTGTAPATSGTKDGSGFSTSLSLNETVDINFYTDPSNLANGNRVKVMRNGVETAEFTQDTMTDGRIRIRYSVRSDRMCDMISVQIVDAQGNPVKEARSMSAREYAKILLGGKETNAVEHELLVAMLNYGTLAQVYDKDGTTDYADRYLTDDMRQMLADFWK